MSVDTHLRRGIEFEQNSTFRDFCTGLFTKESDLFAMLAVYLDDSGTSPTDPVAVVAGYLATEKMWNEFEKRWTVLLSKYNIKILHRADLESYKGEFKNWDEQRRVEFLKKAHAIIRRCTYTAVGSSLVKSDYDLIIKNHEILRRFGIFSWCAQGALSGVRMWCDSRNVNSPIQYVFEAGTEGSSQFANLLESYYRDDNCRADNRIGGWSFLPKQVIPLQAADVVAYEFFRYVKNEVVDNKRRRIRLSLIDLFRPPQNPMLVRHFNRKAFENMVACTPLTRVDSDRF